VYQRDEKHCATFHWAANNNNKKAQKLNFYKNSLLFLGLFTTKNIHWYVGVCVLSNKKIHTHTHASCENNIQRKSEGKKVHLNLLTGR